MITKLYSLKDLKANIFNPPFPQSTPGMAERALKQMMKQDGSPVGIYPEDFELFEVGTFDDEQGRVEPYTSPKFLVRASTLVEIKN